jgi:hypothetical protein
MVAVGANARQIARQAGQKGSGSPRTSRQRPQGHELPGGRSCASVYSQCRSYRNYHIFRLRELR